MSLLVISDVLWLFVNILTVDHKYSLCSRENLQHPIHMQLSKKKEIIWVFFALFLKSTSNFEHFVKKDDPHSWCILEITDWERRG